MRTRALLAVGLLLGATLAVRWLHAPVFRLPRRIRIEEVTTNLPSLLDARAIVVQDAAAPVHLGGLTPGSDADPAASYRSAIIAPPGTRLRFRAAVPEGGRLRLSAGVERGAPPGTGVAPVRFRVRVDDAEAWACDIDAQRKRHRRWFDADIDLRAWAGREVDIELSTEVTRTGAPPSGTPGWSRPRLVRTREQDRQATSAESPSVLLLLVDTLRADRLGFHGAANPTPTIDALARRGFVAEQAMAPSSWTMPSVASILTGLPPHSHGVTARRPGEGDAPQRLVLPDALLTLAEHVERAGVTTMAISTNPLVSRGTNFAQGFETFVERGWDNRAKKWPSADEVNAIVLDWLRENGRHRFFAYVHYLDPHDPYTPPLEWQPDAPAGASAEVRAGSVHHISEQINWQGAPLLPLDQIAYLSRLYDGEVTFWDRELARLLDGVAATGIADSTIVIVTADHGEEFQEHGGLKHGKHLYEESIHVPLVIAGPGITPGRLQTPTDLLDLFPTVCGLLGIAPPPGLPGQSLLGPRHDRPAVAELQQGPGWNLVALRMGDWKLIRSGHSGRREMYDLAADPGERDDRVDRAPEAPLAAALDAWFATTPTPPPAEGVPPDLRERLRALGYAR